MKILWIIFIVSILFLGGCTGNRSAMKTGKIIVGELRTYSVDDLIQQPNDFLGKTIKLQAKISKVDNCPKEKLIGNPTNICGFSCGHSSVLDYTFPTGKNIVLEYNYKPTDIDSPNLACGPMSWCLYEEQCSEFKSGNYILIGKLSENSAGYVFTVSEANSAEFDFSVFRLDTPNSHAAGMISDIVLNGGNSTNQKNVIFQPNDKLESKHIEELFWKYVHNIPFSFNSISDNTVCLFAKDELTNEFANGSGSLVKYLGNSEKNTSLKVICGGKEKILAELSQLHQPLTPSGKPECPNKFSRFGSSNNSYCIVLVGEPR